MNENEKKLADASDGHRNFYYSHISDIRNTFSLKKTFVFYFILPVLLTSFFFSDFVKSYNSKKLLESCVEKMNYDDCHLYIHRSKKMPQNYKESAKAQGIIDENQKNLGNY